MAGAGPFIGAYEGKNPHLSKSASVKRSGKLLVMMLALASASLSGSPDWTNFLQAYSHELQALEPFQEPFVAYFRKADKELFFVAAHHQNRADRRP